MSQHVPVLLNEVLDSLDPQPGDFMIDGTMDGGGHAATLMEKIGPDGIFLGVDLDPAMVSQAKEKFSGTLGNYFVHGNYANLPEILAKEKLGKADGLLLDLGFSSEQIEQSGRGFSFSAERADEPLLMTYDDSRTPVYELLRTLSEQDLANIIFELGGERGSRRIARAIKDQGRRRPIRTAGELAKTLRLALPASYERGRIDPATRTFQALRIYANDELENVKTVLGNLEMILKPGGRAAIITFHSLEDRMVKQAFQKMAKEKQGELLNKKPITATREEVRGNSRSRSAKLRAIKLLS